MNALTEKLFTDTWRSYKVFLRSGNIKQQTQDTFLEFAFTGERLLTITEHIQHREKKLAQTDKWTINFQNKAYYLCCKQPFFSYEVITVNHTALVLLDNTTGEKIFLCKKASWEMHLKNNTNPVM